MVFDFSELVVILEDFRVMDVLLPFLLIFTIIFAILQKTKIMGKGKKQYNVIIALVVSLSVVIPHVTGSYPAGIDVVEIIMAFLPQIALIAVVLVMMLILIGVFAPGSASIISLVGMVLVFFLFLGTTEYIYGLDWLYRFFGEETISTAFILLVLGLLIFFITSESKGEKTVGAMEKVWDKLFGES